MCSVTGAGTAELYCSVLEEDWHKGQSYAAHWHSLTTVPQYQHRSTVMEAELSAKHREARRLLQRFLSGAISKNDQHPKTHPARQSNQPVSEPSATGPKVQGGPVHIQKAVCCVTGRPKSTLLQTSERKTVVKMTQLPRFLG